MIQHEQYPAYSGRERPPMGRDLGGRDFFQCFTVTIERQESYFMPYRFVEFISDYTRQKGNVCLKCIRDNARLKYTVEDFPVDRSAVDRKFFNDYNAIDEGDYYCCPRIGETLDASRLSIAQPEVDRAREPMRAILSGNWDAEYLFELLSIAAPREPSVCAVYRDFLQLPQTDAE